MVIKINLSNRIYYTIITISILLILGTGVYAVTGVSHSLDEINLPTCSTNQILKWSGSNWICGEDTGITTDNYAVNSKGLNVPTGTSYGGFRLGQWPTHNSPNVWAYFSRGNSNDYANLALGSLWVAGTPYLSSRRNCGKLYTDASGIIRCGVDNTGTSLSKGTGIYTTPPVCSNAGSIVFTSTCLSKGFYDSYWQKTFYWHCDGSYKTTAAYLTQQTCNNILKGYLVN
ncbi:MAG: hypothetical protein ABFQ65_02295 [Nanoarchaeota archaeon]